MKNKNVLKAFGIMLLVTIVLTWIIPSGTVGESGITIGSIQQTGFADIFNSLEVVTTYFVAPSLFILFVGMFYGVANASGSLKAVTNKLTTMFKNRKELFVIITVLFYALLTALTGMYIPVFMFVPLSIAVLLGLKYNKTQSILATVGASTIGLISQIFNPTIKNLANVQHEKFIWVKVGLFVVLAVLTILYVIKISKKEKAEKKEETSMFVPEARTLEKKATVKGTTMFILLGLLLVVFVLGLTSWNTDAFSKAYDAIKGVKIGNFAIFSAILGRFEVFGSWTYASLVPTVACAIIVLSIATHTKFSEMIEESYNGAKKVMSMAIVAALLSLVLIFTLNSGFMGTVINFIAKSGNIALVVISALVSTPFMVDLNYALQYVLSMIFYSTNNNSLLELYGTIVQSIYGVVMLIAPTSVLLVISLMYTEETYSKWFKYIWKFVLAVLVAVLIAITIAAVI